MSESNSPRPFLYHCLGQQQSRFQQIFREARTRILLMYVVSIILLMAAAIPVFRTLLFASVDRRVRVDLKEEVKDFESSYVAWQQQSSQRSIADFQVFADQYLSKRVPEDDNFLLILINDQFYRSNPSLLIAPLQPNSPLFRRWQQVTEFRRGEWETYDAKVSKILYKIQPFMLEGNQRVTFVVAHSTAGERNESLGAVYVFIQIASGVIAISLILAWFVAGQLLAPVRDLAETARIISETDLSQRLPVRGTGELADLAETFNEMMDRLQSAFESQQDFMNDAGHELRTPITIVRGHLELMDEDPQEQQATIELVLDELDRMGRLVNDLILLAKSERPDFLRLEAVDVKDFAQELFNKAQTLGHRDWQLTLRADQQLMCDRQRVTGALLNLLRNAVQHTQENDTIELGCGATPTEARFWVRDTGVGIAPSDQAQIFERFARAKHRRRSTDGSGLGLAIVRAIAEAHRGRVELISAPYRGATFTICLP